MTTIAALAVIVVTKFAEGAWIVVLALPATVWLLLATHRYHASLDGRLAVSGPFMLEETEPPTVLWRWRVATGSAIAPFGSP